MREDELESYLRLIKFAGLIVVVGLVFLGVWVLK